MLTRISLLVALCLPVVALAQALDVTRGTAAPVKVELGYGIELNKGSSLSREWVVINDPAIPLQIERGYAEPKYLPDRSRGSYRYAADYVLKAGDQGVRAYEIRFLVLDVFGERQRLLSASRLVDIAAEATWTDNGQWNLFSESDAATAFYSIAYVAAVRTESGRIYRARLPEVLAEIQKISNAIKASDIEREKPGPSP